MWGVSSMHLHKDAPDIGTDSELQCWCTVRRASAARTLAVSHASSWWFWRRSQPSGEGVWLAMRHEKVKAFIEGEGIHRGFWEMEAFSSFSGVQAR